jgi:hypothetical protein
MSCPSSEEASNRYNVRLKQSLAVECFCTTPRHASPAERLNKVLYVVLAVRSITGTLLGGSCANWVKLFGAVTRISLPPPPPPPKTRSAFCCTDQPQPQQPITSYPTVEVALHETCFAESRTASQAVTRSIHVIADPVLSQGVKHAVSFWLHGLSASTHG